jgi:hypothetical protein
MTAPHKQQIRALIKEYAGSGTETLIAFVAGKDGMLAACQALLDNRAGIEPGDDQWLQEECAAEKVNLHAFLQEISKIVTLFQPDRNGNDHYATLGVPPDAGPEEIKQAYRSLSRRYHPDTAAPEYRNQPEKFVAINKAYHALIGNGDAAEPEKTPPAAENSWRPKKKRTVTPEQRKKVFTWGLGLLLVLVIITTIASINYKKRAMLVGLQQSRGAFIPPPAKTQTPPSAAAEISPENPEPLTDIPPARAQTPPAQTQTPSALTDRPITQRQPQKEKTPPAVVSMRAPIPTKPAKIEDPSPPPVGALSSPGKPPRPATESFTPPGPVPVPIAKPTPSPISEPPAAPSAEPELFQTTIIQPALPPPAPEKPEIPDIQGRIDQFLADYIDAYQQRNLILFSRFFQPDAEENGKPFTAMLPTYLDLFAATSRIVMEIDGTSWRVAEKTVYLNGNFQVLLQYSSGKRVGGSGPIDFVLVEKGDQFLVEKMNYVFHAE